MMTFTLEEGSQEKLQEIIYWKLELELEDSLENVFQS